MTRPPRPTSFLLSPRSICSAEGPARLAFGTAGWPAATLSAALERFLCKSRLHFLPIYTATVVRCVVFPAGTALGLFPRGTATTGEVGASTNDAPGCVSAVTLRVAEAMAAVTLQWAFGTTYESTWLQRPQSSVSDRTFDTSGPRATDIMKWGWEGGLWRGPGRDGRNAAE